MLFADITGSTALTEKLDAEEAHDLLYGATQRMCSTIENHRGTVCRFMGDGVMAMFGAPMASEQHAVEACEAALEMQRAIRDYATKPETSELRIRVGLHSGEIVVLTVGEGDKVEYDASGPTVPIAARMEQSATPGEIYLTAATQSLASRRIETEALAPVSVKGISGPIPVFSLRRVRSVEEVIPDAKRTPFVGRRAELTQFRGAFDTCIEEGHGQTVYVRGEPGIGKTRLVEEFTKITSDKGVLVLRCLVLPFGVGKGQDAIRSLVRSLLGIVPGGSKDDRQLAAQTALNDCRLKPDQAVFLNDLLDLSQPIAQKALYDAMDNLTRNEGKQAVVSELAAAAASNHPIVILVEDVHWADSLTLAHLSVLTRTVADCPALLVMTSRIEGDPLDQSWRSTTDGSPFVAIDLGPLRKQDSIALIGEFIDTSDTLAESCLERAAGNPLFLEQLLRNAREGTTESLPDSIQSLVLARVDRLDPEDRRALQVASVLGQRFDGAVLNHLLDRSDYDPRELMRHNLARKESPVYLFAHALIQEGVYGSLLKRQKVELHRKAAEWYEHNDLVLYAEHLGQAGDENAPAAFAIAAQDQAQQFRSEKALALVNRGLSFVSESDSFVLQFLQGELLHALGLTTQSIDALRQASESASTDIERCRAWVGVAEGLRIIDDHENLMSVLSDAEIIAERHGLSAELAAIYKMRSGVHFFRGESDACLKTATAAVRHAQASNSPELEAKALSALADAEYNRGRMISAHHAFDRCIKLAQAHGLGRIAAANMSMRALTYWYQNNIEMALEDAQLATELAVQTRQLRAEAMALLCGASVADYARLSDGEDWINRSVAIARQIESRLLESSVFFLGKFALRKGKRKEAVKILRDGLEVLRSVEAGMSYQGPWILGALALATENPTARRSALKEGEELLRGESASHNYLAFYPDAMEACLEMAEWDEVKRYAQALEDYTRAEPLPQSDYYIAWGRALAAFGRGLRDQATTDELKRLLGEATRVGLKIATPALEEALAST